MFSASSDSLSGSTWSYWVPSECQPQRSSLIIWVLQQAWRQMCLYSERKWRHVDGQNAFFFSKDTHRMHLDFSTPCPEASWTRSKLYNPSLLSVAEISSNLGQGMESWINIKYCKMLLNRCRSLGWKGVPVLHTPSKKKKITATAAFCFYPETAEGRALLAQPLMLTSWLGPTGQGCPACKARLTFRTLQRTVDEHSMVREDLSAEDWANTQGAKPLVVMDDFIMTRLLCSLDALCPMRKDALIVVFQCSCSPWRLGGQATILDQARK